MVILCHSSAQITPSHFALHYKYSPGHYTTSKNGAEIRNGKNVGEKIYDKKMIKTGLDL
jgi:hypothetical protein